MSHGEVLGALARLLTSVEYLILPILPILGAKTGILAKQVWVIALSSVRLIAIQYCNVCAGNLELFGC